jgi:hypothetical protein
MKNKWIPVSNQTPELNVEVLGKDAFYGHIGICIWQTTRAYPNGQLDDEGKPFLVFTDSQKDDCNITHWQPLSD